MAAPTGKAKRSTAAPGGAGAGGVGVGGKRGAAAGRAPVLQVRRALPAPVLQVRRALPGDGPAVERLRGQLENLHARLLPDYFRPSSGLHRPPPELGVTTWVGEADRVVRGYLIARLVDTPIDPAMMPARRVQIVELCVEAAFRRLGIGTRLMDEVIAWGRDAGASEAVLTVWSHNRAAFGLYGELGFQPLARIMRLSLGAAATPADAANKVGGGGSGKRRGEARVPSGPRPGAPSGS